MKVQSVAARANARKFRQRQRWRLRDHRSYLGPERGFRAHTRPADLSYWPLPANANPFTSHRPGDALAGPSSASVHGSGSVYEGMVGPTPSGTTLDEISAMSEADRQSSVGSHESGSLFGEAQLRAATPTASRRSTGRIPVPAAGFYAWYGGEVGGGGLPSGGGGGGGGGGGLVPAAAEGGQQQSPVKWWRHHQYTESFSRTPGHHGGGVSSSGAAGGWGDHDGGAQQPPPSDEQQLITSLGVEGAQVPSPGSHVSGTHSLLGQQDQQGLGADARSLRQPDWRPNPRRRPASASLWRSLEKQPHQHACTRAAAAAAAVKTAAVASSRRGHYEFPPGALRRPSSAATARAKAKAGKQRRSRGRGGVERGGSLADLMSEAADVYARQGPVVPRAAGAAQRGVEGAERRRSYNWGATSNDDVRPGLGALLQASLSATF
jgi:hypothetical protein